MQSIQALRERRNEFAKQTRALMEINPGDKWNADLQKTYDNNLAQIDRDDAEIGRIQKVLDLQAEERFIDAAADVALSKTGDKKAMSESRQLYVKWLRGGNEALSAAEMKSFRNTMSTTTTTQGGHTVQTDIAETLVDALKDFGGMREAAEVLRTAQGNPLSFPSSDGTAETGEQIAENVTATGLDPSFGTVPLNVYKFSSKIIACPIELLQDTSIDMEAFIRTRIQQRLGRITNTRFTTGTGSSQPNGVVTAAGVGKTGTSGQTVTVIVDDLIDLVHSVDPAYRKSGRGRFMMNDLSLRNVRKLKDTTGRPIFMPGYDGLGVDMGDMVLGFPVTVNQDIAVMAANAKSIAFGDFWYYKIRDVMEATLFRFTDSKYTELGQVGFLAWMRSGGNLVDTNAVKFYQNSAT
jgi:HK97 family phage major capsid protein